MPPMMPMSAGTAPSGLHPASETVFGMTFPFPRPGEECESISGPMLLARHEDSASGSSEEYTSSKAGLDHSSSYPCLTRLGGARQCSQHENRGKSYGSVLQEEEEENSYWDGFSCMLASSQYGSSEERAFVVPPNEIMEAVQQQNVVDTQNGQNVQTTPPLSHTHIAQQNLVNTNIEQQPQPQQQLSPSQTQLEETVLQLLLHQEYPEHGVAADQVPWPQISSNTKNTNNLNLNLNSNPSQKLRHLLPCQQAQPQNRKQQHPQPQLQQFPDHRLQPQLEHQAQLPQQQQQQQQQHRLLPLAENREEPPTKVMAASLQSKQHQQLRQLLQVQHSAKASQFPRPQQPQQLQAQTQRQMQQTQRQMQQMQQKPHQQLEQPLQQLQQQQQHQQQVFKPSPLQSQPQPRQQEILAKCFDPVLHTSLLELLKPSPQQTPLLQPTLEIAAALRGHALSLANDRHGCRVLQALLEVAPLDVRVGMVAEMLGRFKALVTHMHGNFVVQRSIECLPAEHLDSIIQEIQTEALELSVHPYGCRTIQRLLEKGDRRQLHVLLQHVITASSRLAHDTYGNIVVRHALQHCCPEAIVDVVDSLLPHPGLGSVLATLGRHRSASLVLEKCLDLAATGSQNALYSRDDARAFEECRRRIVKASLCLAGNGKTSVLQELSFDRFGNYLAQRIVQDASNGERKAVQEQLMVIEGDLQKSSSGKHVLAALRRAPGGAMGRRGQTVTQQGSAALQKQQQQPVYRGEPCQFGNQKHNLKQQKQQKPKEAWKHRPHTGGQ